MLTTLLSFSMGSAQVLKQKTLEELNADLVKINKSIDETREKIRTIKDARFLPDIYFMLAELHTDKSRYLQSIKRLDNKGTPDEELDFTNEKRPKQQAIEIYQQIIDKFPTLRERDKAFFYMAHEHRELGQMEEMVKIYSNLAKDHPESRYWAETHIILGNYFFETKKNFEISLELYQKILSRPDGPFTPLARYKLGWVFINLNKFKEALLSFEQVLGDNGKIDLSDLPEIYRKTDVRRDALLALVWPYSEMTIEDLQRMGKGREDPLKYFLELSNNKISYQKVLKALGRRLSVKHRYVFATRVYFELLRISNDLDDKMEAVDKVYQSMKATKTRWPVNGYVDQLVRTVNRVNYNSAIKTEEKKKIQANYEIYGRDVATRFHERAKETKSKEDYGLAIRAYRGYLFTFPNSKSANEIRLNLAESYFNLRRYVEAGKTYEELSRRIENKSKRKSYLDSALESYTEALKSPAELSRLELTESRNGLRDVGATFIRQHPGDRSIPSIRFNIGRTFYDERNFDMAVKAFKVYVKNHPGHSDSRLATDLILDSYNQREDYAGLAKAGRELLKNSKLSAEIKRDIDEIVKQAEYKKMQARAGDFTSPDYTKNLLQYAAKYKGSSLGDRALYEAFVNTKNKRDPRAYELGEQLIMRHADSKYAKEVVSSMGQMALTTADFRRAAKFFEFFSKKYPSDKEANLLMKNAAQIREMMGDFDEAAANFATIGDRVGVSRMEFQSGRWSNLAKSAQSLPGIRGSYWRGLAHYRLGNFSMAHAHLKAAADSGGRGNYDENQMSAHALFLLSSEALKQYKDVQMMPGSEAKAVQEKNKMLSILGDQLNRVIRFGNGRWTIAALHGLGQANIEFAEFIKNAPTPSGLTPDQTKQFKTVLDQQAAPYLAAGMNFFRQCLQSAEKNEVFSLFAISCKDRGHTEVDESQETKLFAKSSGVNPRGAEELRKKLYDSPRDTGLLTELARTYTQSGDYAMSQVILNRILEIKPNAAFAIGMQGMNSLFMNDLEGAHQFFKKGLKESSQDPTSLWGMAALYHHFKYKKWQHYLDRAKTTGRLASPIHEWVQAIQ